MTNSSEKVRPRQRKTKIDFQSVDGRKDAVRASASREGDDGVLHQIILGVIRVRKGLQRRRQLK